MKAHYEHSHSHGSPGSDTCSAHNRVHTGDRYTLISRYENDEPLEGVMGISLAYVWRGPSNRRQPRGRWALAARRPLAAS